MEDKSYLLALWQLPEMRLDLFNKLVAHFGSGKAVWQADLNALRAVAGIKIKTIEAILKGREKINREKAAEKLKYSGIQLLSFQDKEYPALLKEIPDPPRLLFIRGELKAAGERVIAVVGSRRASRSGLIATGQLCRELCRAGFTIASGMARGIDSAAHQAALAMGGRTIAVLGCGVDVVYPPENRKLQAEIEKQGAVISEFPPGTPPLGWHFPARNRIISGLSLGVVIVEAGEKSGALITAGFALEQGREVFAVPGSIQSETTRGSNYLLKQGAKLVEGINDILAELNLPPEEKKALSHLPHLPLPLLSELENKIFAGIPREGKVIEELLEESRLSSAQVLPVLFSLESKGLIKRLPGNFYLRD